MNLSFLPINNLKYFEGASLLNPVGKFIFRHGNREKISAGPFPPIAHAITASKRGLYFLIYTH